MLATCTSSAALADSWDLINEIRYLEEQNDGEWTVIKEVPAALVDAAGGQLTISGFYVPIEAEAYTTNFLLVPDPADCPFCGSGGYGVTLEVFLDEPMPDVPEATEVSVTGTLELVDDPQTYQAVRLVGARPVLTN
ncbi:hypothetical protein [Pelagovum pacificum]|nr:hypothetical protein [Pelagovum pacificum]QQA42512.1 hypothetical protein I8N54_17265 [Pelagovum pacificum]